MANKTNGPSHTFIDVPNISENVCGTRDPGPMRQCTIVETGGTDDPGPMGPVRLDGVFVADAQPLPDDQEPTEG
jgi:hypothetical protein